ncbi:MAG TPA: pitrilysin family protein [Elusimicrobiota bacterium]|nr:pitrilysin family protein [Elusimicrobiota bacterium]
MKRRILCLILLTMMPLLKTQAATTSAKKMPNGLLWIHRRVTHNQIVAFHLFFPGGSSLEPAAKAGITALTASVMFKGTVSRSALRIAQEAESLGAALDSQSANDYWEVSGQSVAENFNGLFDLFQDVLLHPSFPAEEFAKEKAAHLNDIRAKKEHIFEVAYDRLQKETFGDHPYARPEEGTESSVGSLTRDDLVDWHRTTVSPNGAVLVTVGNLPAKKMESLLRRAFAGWTAAGETPAAPGAPVYNNAPVSAEEPHPFEQSYLMLAYPAPGVDDPSYPAVKVLNAYLGAGMSSPLFQAVREQGSLAYEVSSFYGSRKWGSAFVIYAGTDPSTLNDAERRMAHVLKNILQRPLTPEELADTQRYIRGHYMMDHQTNSRMAWYLGWWEMLEKKHEHDARYPADVAAVSVEDVRRAARTIFSRPAVRVVIRSQKKKS